MISNIPFYYKCSSCASKGKTREGQDACAKFKIPIDVTKDFCAWHSNEDTSTCASCGSSENLIINQIDDKNIVLCQSCSAALYTCGGCANANICAFKADHSEPQIVMRTVRQGMMTMQTQGKNPNLVAKHCTTCRCAGAPVGPDDYPCLKDNQGAGCANWQLNPNLSI